MKRIYIAILAAATLFAACEEFQPVFTGQYAEPQPEQLAEPVVEMVPASEPVSEPEQQVVPEQQPQEEQQTVQEPAAINEPQMAQEQTSARRGKGWITALIVIVCILVVLAVAFAIAGRVFPEWVDQFLYTPEELRILNHRI